MCLIFRLIFTLCLVDVYCILLCDLGNIICYKVVGSRRGDSKLFLAAQLSGM